MINVITKLMPVAAKTIGWRGALEIGLFAGTVAEGLNLGISKGGKAVKDFATKKAEEKKAKLEEQKAMLLAQKAGKTAVNVTVIEEPEEEEKEEVKPAKSSKKKNK